MRVLALNCGSSSVRCESIETSPAAIEANCDRRLGRVLIERIGTPEAVVRAETGAEAPSDSPRRIADHQEAIGVAVSLLKGDHEIEAVGHRVVHGGEKFSAPAELNEAVAQEIEELNGLAPLHNPANLMGYRAARAVLPRARHVAVFDTAFHQTLAPRAYVYGLPDAVWRKHGVRRYGFHGSSHRYVAGRYAQLHGHARDDYKLITCHLGNGCSITAVRGGKSVDTSMGFTPLEGLLMGTRCGDVDAGAVLHIMEKEGLTPGQMDHLLNRQSGLYGLSTASNDMRELLELCRGGHAGARLAVEAFCYRAKKYVGAYYAALNGCDGVIFTGGIGENAPAIRAAICGPLDALGIRIDPARNARAVGIEMNIAAEDSRVEVWVAPTDEGLIIARDTVSCLEAGAERRQAGGGSS
jgi:acetate kinase